MTRSNNCENCEFYAVDQDNGQCRRFPPTPVPAPQQTIMGGGGVGIAAVFPPVMPHQSCGEFTQAEHAGIRSDVVDLLQSGGQ